MPKLDFFNIPLFNLGKKLQGKYRTMKLSLSRIKDRQQKLYNHTLFTTDVIKDLDSLHIFMEHHVYAVWDFMCLLKSLQHYICPSTTCWVPNKWMRAGAARLINEIVLSEESDIDLDGRGSISHHDLYCQAMLEMGADAKDFEEFIEVVRYSGFRSAVDETSIPLASKKFMQETFNFIETADAHIIAAAFCFGRETLIPDMFKQLVTRLDISTIDAPKFHYYLERHIAIDGEEHGPASIELIETLCDHDPVHIHEAEQAALQAIDARIKFWDDVEYAIKNKSNILRHN